jgi:hypothetical protein
MDTHIKARGGESNELMAGGFSTENALQFWDRSQHRSPVVSQWQRP